MKVIKLYGERNTGTNYLEQLIKLNFKVKQLRGTVPLFPNVPLLSRINKSEKLKNLYFKVFGKNNLGWKHSNIDLDLLKQKLNKLPNLCVILLVKNPYSFLLSLHKNPYHNYEKGSMNFHEFLVSNWKTHHRENLNAHNLNPIELWNVKAKNYLQIRDAFPGRVILIKYEDLLGKPQEVITSISVFLNISLISAVKNYERSTKNKEKDFNFYAEYYLKEKWREKLDDKAIKVINKYLDTSVSEQMGYTVINS